MLGYGDLPEQIAEQMRRFPHGLEQIGALIVDRADPALQGRRAGEPPPHFWHPARSGDACVLRSSAPKALGSPAASSRPWATASATAWRTPHSGLRTVDGPATMRCLWPLLALAAGCLVLTSANTNAAVIAGPDAATARMLHDLEQVESGWFFIELQPVGTIQAPGQQCVAIDEGARTFGLNVPSSESPPDLLMALRGHGHTAMLQGSDPTDQLVLTVDSDNHYPMARGRTRCIAVAAEIEYRLHGGSRDEPPPQPAKPTDSAPRYVIDMNVRGPVSCVPAATLVKQIGGQAMPDADPHALARALVGTGQHLWFVNQDDAKGTGSVFMGYANSPTERAYVLEHGLGACQAQKEKINAALVMSRLQSR